MEPSPMLVTIALVLLVGALGSELARRAGLSRVLGEVGAGIALAGLLPWLQGWWTPDLGGVDVLAELGVALLLFEVGLEADLGALRRVAGDAVSVALIGVVVPAAGGVLVMHLVAPGAPLATGLFVGAALAATSMGITAGVLRELDAASTPEAVLISGAALLDDLLGLAVLAGVTGWAATGGTPSATGLALAMVLPLASLLLAMAVGEVVVPWLWVRLGRDEPAEVVGGIGLGLALGFAGLAGAVGLSPIVGAFAAGLVLQGARGGAGDPDMSEVLDPFIRRASGVFAPVFFVWTGLQLELEAVQPRALLVAGLLLAVAVLGKVAAGLGVRSRGVDRVAVGLGMVPRGEVAIVVAGAGAALVMDGVPALDSSTYAALLLVIAGTSMVGPTLLSRRLQRHGDEV